MFSPSPRTALTVLWLYLLEMICSRIRFPEEAQRALQAGRILAEAHLKIDEIVDVKPNLLAQVLLCLAVVGIFPKERVSAPGSEFMSRILRC